MKATVGRAMGLLGGVLTAVGTLLPWATLHGGSVPEPGTPLFLGGAAGGWGAWTILAFGVLGAALALTRRPVAATLGLEVGVLAMFLAVMGWLSLPALAVSVGGPDATTTPGYGLFITLAGTVLLVAGGAVAARKAGPAAPAKPAPAKTVPAPPAPPSSEPPPPEPPPPEE